MTISMRNHPNVIRRMNNLQTDNTGIAKRPLYGGMLKYVIPKYNKLYNMSKDLPSGLNRREGIDKSKLWWPRSIKRYKKLRQQVDAYINVPDIPYKNGPDLLSQYVNPYRIGGRYFYDAQLERNKRAMKKFSGLPGMQRKLDELANAKQFVEETDIYIKAEIEKMYSILPGYRTQQSDPSDPKVRLTWMHPMHQWYAECITFDHGITQTIEANKNDKLEIKLFYDNPAGIQDWWNNISGSVVDCANIDATQFDSSVGKSELETFVEYFGGTSIYKAGILRHLVEASIVMPEGDQSRIGGMPSGSKITNKGDGWINICDFLEVLDRMKLLNYLEGSLINGDDITLLFSTKISDKNLTDMAKYSRREVNPGKTVVGNYVWNSKFYIDNDIMTRTMYRLFNSIMFKEHQTNPLTGSKQYVAIALASQLLDVEQHPHADPVFQWIANIDKYHISKFTDGELREYAEAYVDDHNYNVDWGDGPDQLIKRLKKSQYGQVAV